jgi:hypothetical protein
MTQTKQCTKCKEIKELTEFGKQKGCKLGLRPSCKVCRVAYGKAYVSANRESVQAYKKQYALNNVEKLRKWHREYAKKRRVADPEFKIVHNLRRRMCEILNGTPKSAPTLKLLGCTVEHFRFHLEQQFTDGMTWDNYGDWHMDHIQPCASFDQTDPEQQKLCWHYTNYQPLWAEDNLRKSDTIINEHQTKLL